MCVVVCGRLTFENVEQAADLRAAVALLYTCEGIPRQGVVWMDFAAPPGLLHLAYDQLVWPKHVRCVPAMGIVS